MKINVIIGLTAFIITFFISLANNTWPTSLFRSGVGFLLFFILGYLLRFVLHRIQSKKDQGNEKMIREQGRHGLEEKEPLDNSSFEQIPLTSLHQEEDEGRV